MGNKGGKEMERTKDTVKPKGTKSRKPSRKDDIEESRHKWAPDMKLPPVTRDDFTTIYEGG